MTAFQPGQRVRVEFEAVIDHADDVYMDGHNVCVKRLDNGYAHHVRREDMTLLDPAHWPPKPGEVWDTEDGVRYVVRADFMRLGWVYLYLARHADYEGNISIYGNETLDDFKKLNPHRVFPEG